MIRSIKTFSVLTFRSSTSFTMRFPILLFVITLFAPVISAQFDTAYLPDIDITTYSPDDVQYYPDQTQHYSDYTEETRYFADPTKYNPDNPIVAPPIKSADDDATACDNGSNDERVLRACCLGKAEGKFWDGGWLKVYKCRKCTFRSLFSNKSFFSNKLHRKDSLEEPDCKTAGAIIWCCADILVSFIV